MPKAAESGETKPKSALPSFLVVGTAMGSRRSGVKIGREHVQKMLGWWQAAQPTLKETGSQDLGIPAVKLAEEFGLPTPTNGNSFRASLQRAFDQVSIDGKTVYLGLRGTEGEKFRVTKETMIWFHPVLVSERPKNGVPSN